MTGEIKGRRQPLPRRHIELAAALSPELGDRHHRPLKRRRVKRHPVPHPSKVGQVKHGGSELGELPRKREWAPENVDGGGGWSCVALPVKEDEEEDHTESGQEGLVGRQGSDGGGDPAAVVRRRCSFHHWIVWLVGDGG